MRFKRRAARDLCWVLILLVGISTSMASGKLAGVRHRRLLVSIWMPPRNSLPYLYVTVDGRGELPFALAEAENGSRSRRTLSWSEYESTLQQLEEDGIWLVQGRLGPNELYLDAHCFISDPRGAMDVDPRRLPAEQAASLDVQMALHFANIPWVRELVHR